MDLIFFWPLKECCHVNMALWNGLVYHDANKRSKGQKISALKKHYLNSCLMSIEEFNMWFYSRRLNVHCYYLGPFYRAMAVPSVTRCRCRRGHRCAGGMRRDSSDTWWMVMRRAVARSGEWAQHFSNASYYQQWFHQWYTSDFHYWRNTAQIGLIRTTTTTTVKNHTTRAM